MNVADRNLIALLGSRICHDLISPLGAIGNGVELLEMAGTPSPELTLISESVVNANARIRFFRVAFGVAAPDQEMGRAEIADILGPFGATRRIEIDWQPDAPVPRDCARLIFLLLLCVEGALPWGGAVTVKRNGAEWSIAARAGRLRIEGDQWDALRDGTHSAEATAADVHFPLAAAAAAALARPLGVTVGEDTIQLRF